MTLLRSWGIRIIIYINDMLIMANSKEEASQHLEVLVHLLEALGFIINQEKSFLCPLQEIEFLGLMVDSLALQPSTNNSRKWPKKASYTLALLLGVPQQSTFSNHLKLPGEKLRQICKEATQLLVSRAVSARQVFQFIGKLNAASQAIQVAPCFTVPYRPTYEKPWLWGTRTTTRYCPLGQKPGKS